MEKEDMLINKVIDALCELNEVIKLGHNIIKLIDSTNLNDDEKISVCSALLKTYKMAKQRNLKKEIK